MGCGQKPAAKPGNAALARQPLLRVFDPSIGLAAANQDSSLSLAAAKNEWISIAIQVDPGQIRGQKIRPQLRLAELTNSQQGKVNATSFTAFQVLPMPVDLNHAGYVRHTGRPVSSRATLPRALLPISMHNGDFDLAAARDRAGNEPIIIWIDLHIPTSAPAGDYTGACALLDAPGGKTLASAPISLTVHNFALPDERHLTMSADIDWDTLRRLYPQFETVEPNLISRTDARCASAVRALDQLVALAQANRVQIAFPRIQPSVKWPAGAPVQIDWSDFDSVVGPWLKGDAFSDKVGLSYWPLPAVDFLENYPLASRRQYWAEAASHFDQLNWLSRAVVSIEKPTSSRPNSADSIALSAEASHVLAVNPKLRVSLPLEDSHVQLASRDRPDMIDPRAAGRLVLVSPSLVSAAPVRSWPSDVPLPTTWLRNDLAGPVPTAGAGGDERDVLTFAWLAFLRGAPMIRWPEPLPQADTALQPADPSELIWFYPGSWFGVDQPVPTVQLKWLRRAEQDYEYLWLARQRGQKINALVMSRLITKPVEIQPNQQEDPAYALLCGTAEPNAWSEARRLLAANIELHTPGEVTDRNREYQLNLDTLNWATPLERPILMGRSTQWLGGGDAGMLGFIGLRLGIDIYNASDAQPADNTLQWTSIPPGWQGWKDRPEPLSIATLPTYRVQRFNLDVQIDPARIENGKHRPVELTFTNGFNNRPAAVLKMILPTAICDRHSPGLLLNGSLEDWSADDAIQQNAPLVQYFNRPAVQDQQLQLASTPSSIYSGWSDDHFYVAFKLAGLSQQDLRAAQNFVSYEFGRAWGEDLCELLIQPVYRDSVTGPVLHLVVKPNGSVWVERKGDPRTSADPWPPIEGAGVRFKGTLDGPTWRGEIAIPWRAIDQSFDDPRRGRPVMLRFNFTQHKTDTGESASWAGPIDSGRDDSFTGMLYVRDKSVPGMARQPR